MVILIKNKSDEDPLLIFSRAAYVEETIGRGNSQVRSIEVDATGTLCALVDVCGTISIYERKEKWEKVASWRFKNLDTPKSARRSGANHHPISTTLRPKILVRFSNLHARLLAIGTTNRAKIHVFGETLRSKNQWERKTTMSSADLITEMRFSPAHLEFSLVTGTCSGWIVVHQMFDPTNPKTWRPIHAISVFRDQPISSLSWNQNPVHELPIIVASTNGLTAAPNRRIAVFAINSPSVRPETNMCFESTSVVSCVAFAPSIGLNDSLLAVACGRRICLYLMNVEEFQVDRSESPSDSECESSTPSVDETTPTLSYISSWASDSSPIIPANFFSVDAREQEIDRDSTDDEEEEEEPEDGRRALMWNVRWVTVFRESSIVKSIHWGRSQDSFSAQFADGTVRSYKWSFGSVWTKSSEINLKSCFKG
ncbi:hypothetical protein M3Y98_00895700 [Aphelenchoides besseyi]|nr:hypothetical protein M3Y98_00895700 [Aphelenchoides besseyi]KAI6193040.1 hypothetical protein M3Y96_00975800 [Aphelenchoides besseyi]